MILTSLTLCRSTPSAPCWVVSGLSTVCCLDSSTCSGGAGSSCIGIACTSGVIRVRRSCSLSKSVRIWRVITRIPYIGPFLPPASSKSFPHGFLISFRTLAARSSFVFFLRCARVYRDLPSKRSCLIIGLFAAVPRPSSAALRSLKTSSSCFHTSRSLSISVFAFDRDVNELSLPFTSVTTFFSGVA